jgi:ATP-dependent Lhr-like helicase
MSSGFDQLHPSLQHHIVNTLGWPGLRPLQDEAVGPILAGDHTLLLAPTAGGKTEAASFPVITRIAAESWRPLSVVYLAPLKALLNNLLPRLEQHTAFTGHRVALWHGDIGPTARQRIAADPPDILLTTPESLEAMLISRRVNERWLFPNLRTVIIDEVHAFASADRGWHMLSVLERLTRLCDHEIQRIGLSATVGNPEELLTWLTASCDGKRQVINPPADNVAEPEVELDFVGSLDNAATVVSRIHRGEKRLVFVDSRRRVEELAKGLRDRDIETYVSHGSLGRDERHRAEQAFAEASDCVIVSTSTLELGIDVGDLDRVIQIDAPATVSSFLQRIGRAGRRTGTSRNCLFLATSRHALHQAAGLLLLWSRGYVEPVIPPPMPLHLLTQQLLALTLQEARDGLPRQGWTDWLGEPPALGTDVVAYAEELVEHLLAEGWLFSDGVLLSPGDEAERRYGTRNFMELTSSFVTEPVYSIRHGRNEVGSVPNDALIAAFAIRNSPPALLLGGRAWRIIHVDWRRKTVDVEPDEVKAAIKFGGSVGILGYELCQAMAEIVGGTEPEVSLTRRAHDELSDLRDESPGIDSSRTTLERLEDDTYRWWTYAGLKANIELAGRLAPIRSKTGQRSNYYVSVDSAEFGAFLEEPAPRAEADALAAWATNGLKLGSALKDEWAKEIVLARLADEPAVEATVKKSIRRVDPYA